MSCKCMKELFVTLGGLTVIGTAVDATSVPTWEHLLEKWGIGFVGLALFALLARWTANREERLQLAREKREKEESELRNKLAHELNQLQKDQLVLMTNNAKKLEYLVRAGNLSSDHHASALRMLVRGLGSRPCLHRLDITEVEQVLVDLQAKRAKIAEGQDANEL